MKKLFVLLTAFLLSVPLSACAEKKEFTEPDGKLDPCSIRFSWWGGDDRHEATLKAIELWNQNHPDITIIPEYGGWDGWTEKISSQINGGTAPDVMQINYDWLVSFSAGDKFYDLGKLRNFIDLSGYDDEVLSFGKTNGLLNAVTVSVSGRGLFYNSDVYKSFNAEYPHTWNELLALGDKFDDKGVYPIDLDIQSGGTAWYLSVVYVQQKTGKEFITMDGQLGFSEEDIKTALDFYKQLENNHVIRNVRSRTDEDGNAALYQSPEFISGKVAGVLEWGSSVGKYEMSLPEGVLEAGPMLTDDNGNSDGWLIKPENNHVIRNVRSRTDEDGNAALYQSPEFISGKVAGVLEWGSSVGKYEMSLPEGVLEAGPMLTDDNGNSDGWLIKPSMLYAVSASTKYPDESAAFVNFLLNDEKCADILGTTRGIPASSYAQESLEKSGKLKGLALENDRMLSQINTFTISPYMELARMKEFYNEAIESVSYNTSDTSSAAKKMYDSITKYLEKIKK